jgi:predicted metal-dependent peptidase
MSDASQDEARQIVKDIVDQASQKCQGQSPGHLQDAIAELKKPVVKWCELLHQYLGQHVGNKRSTYSRRCRRQDTFGIPGVSHHAAASVNVIVDTSGSISSKELQQFFSEIEAISSKAKTMVLQWDLQFQGYNKYRRGDWKSFKVNGRGGTDMAAPIQWLCDNHKIADVQIMLTDGYCNYIGREIVNFPIITVVTNNSTESPPYGVVIRMDPTK